MLRILVSLSAGLSAVLGTLVAVETAGSDIPDVLMITLGALDAFSGAALARYVLSEPTTDDSITH